MKKSLAMMFAAAMFLSAAACKEKESFYRDVDSGINAAQIAASAGEWLGKLDKGYYEQAYDETDQSVKNNVSPEKWLEGMQAYRKPAGDIVHRREINMFSQKGDDGNDYLTIQLSSVFSNQKIAVMETITFIKTENGEWKITGYFLK